MLKNIVQYILINYYNYLMNSNENKAYLWEKCITEGIFNNIHKEKASSVQGIFENVIADFLKLNTTDKLDVINIKIIQKLKEEINKTNSFEETQKSYDELLNKPNPPKINFSDVKDEPIKNLDKLLEQTQDSRKDIFKPNVQVDWGKIIKNQNDILIKILETQNTIIGLLKK
uniref:Uncharacterized protein n=1 Tax=viral metagenome TaxID=1070528 RepID=A0A6C0JJP7_9ZZZZ